MLALLGCWFEQKISIRIEWL